MCTSLSVLFSNDKTKAEEITQFSVHVKMRLISQLVNGISKVFQKLL